MFKSCLGPAGGHGLMTVLTLHIKTRLHMIRIFAHYEFTGMTSVAVNGRSGKFIDLLVHMAGFAICDRMNTHQCKTPLRVQVKNLLLILPTIRRVAALAVNSKLTLVNIGVAT